MVTTTTLDTLSSTSSATTNRSNIGSSILLTLGSGSGINIEELATNLTNAEKLPAQNALQGKIDKTEAKISGYGLISSQLGILASSFERINDANEVYFSGGKSSNDNAVSILSVTNDALEGSYDIDVYQLAENHRLSSNSYQSTSGNINNGEAFDLTLSIGITRKGTYDHSITEAQLQSIGDGSSAYIEYSDGSNTLQITQAEIDLAMESLEGSGIYTFANATLDGLISAINSEISKNAGFAANFASAEVHRTKGISFAQTTAGASASLTQPAANDGSVAYNIGSVAQGLISATPVNGARASYTFTPSSAGSDSLEVSDGVTNISIPQTDFSLRTDYELSITESELQAALGSNGSISIVGSDGTGADETVTVNLNDMTTFGLPVPLGTLTLQDLANAINAKASGAFETTAVVDDNKLTFVQKANGSGTVTAATRSDGITISKADVSVTSAEQMAEAMQASSSYDNLKFTVSATSTDVVFDYKNAGVVSAPTFKLNSSDQTASSFVAGVNAVNTRIDTVVKIGAGGDTLESIVTAINNADTGITASVLDISGIGNDYRIVLSGTEGLDGSFSVTTDSSTASNSLGFDQAANVIQAAQDSEIGYEGLLISRGTNVISDVIEGATFQLNSTTGAVSSVPYIVLANGSGGGAGFAYDITKLNGNTVRFIPKAAYVGQNLSAGPSGGPGSGYAATTITNPHGSDPANITVYDVTPLNDSDIDSYLDSSAEPDYSGSITLYDGIGGAITLPRNGHGGFWPNTTTTENGETVNQYVVIAQAASYAAGTGSTNTGGTEDTYTNYTGGGNGSNYLTKYRTETLYDPARLIITRDKSQLKTNLQEIVTAYNDLESLIDELNTDEAVEAGLSLAGEGSLLRSVQNRIYNALTATSSTPSGTVDAVRDLGISVDRYGKLQFDEAKYDGLITTRWDDVVTMLTAGTTGQSLYSPVSKGLGQDVATIINDLKSSTLTGDAQNGLIANRTEALSRYEENYQLELTKLEARMTVLYQRYLNQFTAMETLMNSLNTTRDFMKGQLDVITSAYDKN